LRQKPGLSNHLNSILNLYRSIVASLALALLACGCGSPQKRSFPIGIFGVPSTADFPEIRKAGFDVVVGPSTWEYLGSARQTGLKVLASPPSKGRPSSVSIRTLDAHPALWAWYLIDEPDLNNVPPPEVRTMQRRLRESGARKPSALTLCYGSEAMNYGNIPDLVMVDRYPIPWLPLANFGQHIKLGRLAIGPDKPLFAVIQAFDWTAYPGMLLTDAKLRPPAYEELRCMAYEAVARGANGLFFYEFDGQWKIRNHPELWTSLKQVVGEIRAREPLFQGKPVWWAKQHDFGDPSTAFNAAMESSITSALLRVTAGNKSVPPGDYILAINNTPREVQYSFALPPRRATPANESLPVFEENRSLQPANKRVGDNFGAYAIHVYGPMSPPTP
jgi:hypothetical protein